MANDRELLKIQDLSSCDFVCTGNKLRVKKSSFVIDSSGGNKPGSYANPSGTVPDDLKEDSNIVEVFDDAICYWKQTSCDGTSPTWELIVVVPIGTGTTGNFTSFVDSTGGDSGLTPSAPDSPPTGALEDDTLIEKFDDYTNFWTYDGSDWILNYQLSSRDNYNTFFRDNSAHDVPTTASDPPNPSGTHPSTNLREYDTYVTRYSAHTVHYTYDGTQWVEDFRDEISVAANFKSTDTPNWITLGTDSKLLVTPLAEQGVSILSGKVVFGHSAAGTGLSDFTSNRFLYLNTFSLSIGGSVANAATAPIFHLIGSSGKLGLGTPSPNGHLDITYAAPLFQLSDSTGHADSRRWGIKGFTSSNGDLGFSVSASNSTNPSTVVLTLSKEGRLGLGITTMLAKAHVVTLNTTDVGVIVQGITSQTGDLTQWKNTTTVLSVVDYAGRIGVKTATPTALIHLAAGTATAGTAPIKLTTGTALTIPEDGVFEYHASHLYFTIGGTRYQLDQQLDSADNGVSFSGGVLQLGTSAAGTGAADFTANRYIYQDNFDLSFGGAFGSHDTYPILYIVGNNGRVGFGGTTSPSSTVEIVSNTSLGTTPALTAGLSLVNGVVAAAGAQQISPPIRRKAFGWKTDATAASQSVEFQDYVLPIQGAAAPTGDWVMQSAINGGTFGNKLYYSTTGNLSLGVNATASAKLHVRATANEALLVENSSSVQLLKVYADGIEIGTASIPTSIISSKSLLSYSFTATASNENGLYISGTSQASGTSSHRINGIHLAPTLVSGAASQVLSAFRVNATFTDVNSATKYIAELQTAGSTFFYITNEGRLYSTATFTATANNLAGSQYDGTLSARNSNSDVLSGLLVSTTVGAHSSATGQTINGTLLKQTLTSSISSHVLNGFNVDTTFTYSSNPERNIAIFKNAGTTRLAIKDDGRIYGTALHNNAGDVTGATLQYIASGTYTYTITNGTNVAASTAASCVWTRTGNSVTVRGTITIDPTTTGLTELQITLPIATSSLVGGGVISDIYGGTGMISISTTAQIQLNSVNTGNHVHGFEFGYEIT